MTSEPSGRLYSAVTKHWPKLASALVLTLGVVELAAGGLTDSSGLEFYLMAWAGTTGGVWFLFETAEKSLSEESRKRVVAWLRDTRLRSALESVPDHFVLLFDRVFGSRHLSLSCFARSSLGSLACVLLITSAWLALTFPAASVLRTSQGLYSVSIGVDVAGLVGEAGAVLALAVAMNLIPDYLSLWETRKVMGWAHTVSAPKLLGIDLLLTAAISMAVLLGVGTTAFSYDPAYAEIGVDVDAGASVERPSGAATALTHLEELLTLAPAVGNTTLLVVPTHLVDFEAPPDRSTADTFFDRGQLPIPWRPSGLPPGIFFYSAFFTSLWLWAYLGAVLLSRVLLRMNSGVGFLLRVTDVERQPFRSMGFVSVVIVSVLFALVLPLVLL